MGIVLGIEAGIGIAEAVEAATAATEISTEIGVESTEAAITAGTDAGTEAGTTAATDASTAVEAGGDALTTVLDNLGQAVQKVLKMAQDYVLIDAVFKTANGILQSLTSDPGARLRAEKFKKLIDVLTKSSTIMTTLANWLEANSSDTVNVNDITVTIQGILSKFLPKLGAAAAVLQSLSNTVSTQYNDKKQPITDAILGSIENGIKTVIYSFTDLEAFKEQHCDKIQLLQQLPITSKQISDLTAELP